MITGLPTRSITKNNFFVNPFTSCKTDIIIISPTIQHIAGHSSIHIMIQELMNLLHGNKFSPWEDFFVNPFGSVLTNYVSVHVCTGAAHAVEQ